MTKLETQILESLYDRYEETDSRESQLNYPSDPVEKGKYLDAISNLVDDGYAEEVALSLGFAILKITPAGIRYIES